MSIKQVVQPCDEARGMQLYIRKFTKWNPAHLRRILLFDLLKLPQSLLQFRQRKPLFFSQCRRFQPQFLQFLPQFSMTIHSNQVEFRFVVVYNLLLHHLPKCCNWQTTN
ncbi:hypothetical protein RND81_03G060900 [Saponaria officinalis]|uniref:Uncharacterized protein n=1 Tax=Saponaria officinalis TaxID=3572 RepID=A0AAW1M4B7_SAPOF